MKRNSQLMLCEAPNHGVFCAVIMLPTDRHIQNCQCSHIWSSGRGGDAKKRWHLSEKSSDQQLLNSHIHLLRPLNMLSDQWAR